MNKMEEKRIVKPWQAALMLLVGVAVIIVGLLVMKLNNRIVLALDGVVMCLMAWCFGVPYAELQQGIKDTVSSMIVAILILLAVGVLVGVWMASGTVPVMIYYGMKVLTPGLFLPVVCILCTLMSTRRAPSGAHLPRWVWPAWAWRRGWVCRCLPPPERCAPGPFSATRSRRCRIPRSSPPRSATCR